MERQPCGLSAAGGSDMKVRRSGAWTQWVLPAGQATRRREVLQGLSAAAPSTPIKPRERNERLEAATIERPTEALRLNSYRPALPGGRGVCPLGQTIPASIGGKGRACASFFDTK